MNADQLLELEDLNRVGGLDGRQAMHCRTRGGAS